MNVNIQELLDKIMSILPADIKAKVQSCKSKEDFLSLLSGAKDLIPANLLGGLTGGDQDGKADANPLSGLLSGITGGDKGANPLAGLTAGGNPLEGIGDKLKGVDWSEIRSHLNIGK